MILHLKDFLSRGAISLPKVQVKVARVELLRVITVLLTLSLMKWRTLVISPLELALIGLGTKNVPTNLLVSGLTVIIIIMFFGRFFCGWMCPLGLLLEYSHNLTERKKKRVVGILWKNRLKYAVLFAFLAISFLFDFTPPYMFSVVGMIYATMPIIALIFILDVVALRFGRTWCNSLCPLGTIIGSLSIFNLVKLRVNQKKCIDSDFNCLDCEMICPMRIPVTRNEETEMMDCDKCLRC